MGNLISFYTEIAVQAGVCAACIDGFFNECGRLNLYLADVPKKPNTIPLVRIEYTKICKALGGVFAVSEIAEGLHALHEMGRYHVELCSDAAYVGYPPF